MWKMKPIQSRNGAQAETMLMVEREIQRWLESLYSRYNRFGLIRPDPLYFVHARRGASDRELAGFIASCLAFGRVCQIERCLQSVFGVVGSPVVFLEKHGVAEFRERLEGFRHRYVSGEDLAQVLLALKRILETWGSLEACFRSGLQPCRETVLPALFSFAATLRRLMDVEGNYLVPDPAKGSALKRLNLFLRWMIRYDNVDPGVWPGLPREKLILPLDTHTFRVSRTLGFTARGRADMRTALEATEAFRRINRSDPVKYDFALASLGARTGGQGRSEEPEWFAGLTA